MNLNEKVELNQSSSSSAKKPNGILLNAFSGYMKKAVDIVSDGITVSNAVELIKKDAKATRGQIRNTIQSMSRDRFNCVMSFQYPKGTDSNENCYLVCSKEQLKKTISNLEKNISGLNINNLIVVDKTKKTISALGSNWSKDSFASHCVPKDFKLTSNDLLDISEVKKSL